MSAPRIPALSEEYGLIERLLQIQLNAPQLKIKDAFNIANPGAGSHFTLFCKALSRPNVVTAFIPSSQVSQSPADIAHRGLKVDPQAGLTVTLGSFPLDRAAASFEVLQLKIALGNTLNHQPITLTPDPQFLQTRPTRTMLKPGYHSFCISATNEYIVFERSQVQCIAFVRFAGGPNIAEVNDAEALCQICHEAEATVYCVTDGGQFCDECDAATHTGDRADHERHSLVDERLQHEFCPNHPKVRIAFYCPECRLSLCRRCKMKGAHTDSSGHLLVPIKRAYKRVLRFTAQTDPGIEERRAVIENKMALCQAVISELAANQERLEAEIARLVAEAIEQERLIAGEKALVVRSVQTELYRKLGEMEALQRSFADHRRKSGPLSFLRAVDTQAQALAQMQSLADLPLDLTVQGDLVVYGPRSSGRAFVKANRQRLGALERVAGDDEISQLNRWVAGFVPGFADLHTDFEDGTAFIRLLQGLRPGERPALPYAPIPETVAEMQAARRAAVAFAKALGVTGDWDEGALCVRVRDTTRIVALLRAVQKDLGTGDGRSSRSPRGSARASPRAQPREGTAKAHTEVSSPTRLIRDE